MPRFNASIAKRKIWLYVAEVSLTRRPQGQPPHFFAKL